MRFLTSTLAIVVALVAVGLAGAGESDELTPVAAAAVKALFPDGTVRGVGQEREQGVQYYEVVVQNGGERIEVEVTQGGAIGEIESVVDLGSVPQAARKEIVWITRAGEVKRVERHEIRGTPRDGTFAPMDPAVILYEIVFEAGGRTQEFVVAADGTRPAPEQDDDGPEEKEDDD